MNNTREDLVKDILTRDGLVVSEATLKVDDLLTTFYAYIRWYNLSEEMLQRISSFFDEEPTPLNYFYGICHILPEKEEEASYYLNEDVFDFFNEIAPDGYYFGSNEGDGACFGFWRFSEEE